MKRWIVETLEGLCNKLNHPFGCRLAAFSAWLDEKWGDVGWVDYREDGFYDPKTKEYIDGGI